MHKSLGHNYLLRHRFSAAIDESEAKPNESLPGFRLGVICVTLAYIIMTVTLVYVFGRLKKLQYLDDINRGSSSKRTGDRISLWHFIFLQLCIVTRIIESALILFYDLELLDTSNIREWLLSTLYEHSIIFLWVAFSLQIFQYKFISLRVYLYANLTDVDTFKAKFRTSRLAFVAILSVLLSIQLVIMYCEVSGISPVTQELNLTAVGITRVS